MSKRTSFSNLFSTRRSQIDPRLFRDESFYYYSIPAFDQCRQPHVTGGHQIESAKFVVDPGTILISKLNPRLKRVWRVQNDGKLRSIASTEFINLIPQSREDTGFLSQLLSSDSVYRLLECKAMGTTNSHVRFRYEDLEAIRLKIAPKEAREWIAGFLDRMDSRIEQTEALIAKYQQIKAGVMQSIFRRGVVTCGQLRPPSVEAPHLYENSRLGSLPKDWLIGKLGDHAEIVSGVTLGGKFGRNGSLEIPYLRVANVQDGYLDLSEMKTVRVPQSYVERLRLQYGDVLMNEGGDFDKLGRGCVWREEISRCIHQNHVFRVRPRTSILRSDYLAFWCESEFGKQYFRLSSKQSTNLASINSSQLNRLPVALPSTAEQREIEIRIQSVNAQISSLFADAAKLRHIKLGLMQHLLTGPVRINLAESTAA